MPSVNGYRVFLSATKVAHAKVMSSLQGSYSSATRRETDFSVVTHVNRAALPVKTFMVWRAAVFDQLRTPYWVS